VYRSHVNNAVIGRGTFRPTPVFELEIRGISIQ